MKLPLARRLYVVCLILGIAICGLWIFATDLSRSDEPRLPSSVFLISNDDQEAVFKKAQANDLPAIRRLIDHFERSGGHVAEAEVWRERARALGDPTELRLHASELYMRAKYSSIDLEEKVRILEKAKVSANLSQKGESNDATRKLIATIQLELDELHQQKGLGPKG